MYVPFFDFDGMTFRDTRALHAATRSEVLGSHRAEEDTSLRRIEFLGRTDEEAVRRFLPDPSDEDPQGSLEARAGGSRKRVGKKIGLIPCRRDLRESGLWTVFCDGNVLGGAR